MTRRAIFLLLVAAASFGIGSSHAAEDSPDLPLRKAGLWELQTETNEGAGARKQQLTMCIGEEMERNSVISSGIEHRSNCSSYEVKKLAGATVVDATCAYDDRHITSHTELTGDFSTKFRVEVQSATSGRAPRAQGGQPINVRLTIIQNGRYLGESCGGLQAGEAKGADGMTVNVQ